VKEFFGSCNVCAQTKNPRRCFHGLFQPLSICASLWYLIFMGFITDLVPFSFYDSTLVVVGHLTKMVHFIACTKTITNEGTTKLFLDHVF
jgi:hypothetical protein